MHREFLIGDPDKDPDSREEQLRPITDAAKGIAGASAPVIAHRVLQRTGAVGSGDMYPGETSLHDLPSAAGQTFAGAMVGPLSGEPLASSPESAEERAPSLRPIARPSAAERAPAPEAPKTMIGRAGDVALRRAGRIPGVQAVKDANYILRGPGEKIPPAPIAKPTPAPIPETNGVPWGSGGEGPIELRGQRIPPEDPALTSEARTLPGQIGKEVIRPPRPIAKPLPAQRGLSLPPASDPILDRLRANAAKIAVEGHGDEIPEEVEATPVTTNLDKDLTPALKASLAKVRAAKRIAARPQSQSVQ
jgi:hypothetical protein